MLDISLLGTGGMMPLPSRFLTSMIARFNGNLFLVDCGEGTQVSLKMLGWGFKQIGVICFTHFHADHISGLPGMLLAIANAGREDILTIIGPEGISNVVEHLRVIAPELPYPIEYYEAGKGPFYFDGISISSLPVVHRVPCFAYRLEVERAGKFNAEKAKALGLPVQYWSKLQKGESVEFEGNHFTPDMVLGAKRKSLKVCYATDLRPGKHVVQFAQDADLFICEGIYGDNENKQKAINYKHCIFSEAAQMARDAQVKELWLTHLSPSLVNPNEFLNNATCFFENTVIGKDRMEKTLLFQES